MSTMEPEGMTGKKGAKGEGDDSNRPMIIISASRRTDIPAFYSEWFMNRIREGHFVKVNPYNPNQRKNVSLLPKDVEVIVFWTKNPMPLMQHLPVLDEAGYRYYFHFTLNSYPDVFEPRVPSLKSRIDIFKQLSDKIGSDKVVWRYDPIIISRLTPLEYHLDHFGKLAGELSGFTSRVVISFVVLYSKVSAKFKKLEKDFALQVVDIRAEENLDTLNSLTVALGSIARMNGMDIYSCSEKIDLSDCHIKHGSCIDPVLINQVFSLSLTPKKDQYQRPECLCAESVDMGFYDTCKFNCSYCYANLNDQAVLKNAVRHNPGSPVLIGE
jgi:hypothetical protein